MSVDVTIAAQIAALPLEVFWRHLEAMTSAPLRRAALRYRFLTDRATFLLCCDEAERRGVEFLREIIAGGPDSTISMETARTLWAWECDPADGGTMIAALARALRDTAPKEPDHG